MTLGPRSIRPRSWRRHPAPSALQAAGFVGVAVVGLVRFVRFVHHDHSRWPSAVSLASWAISSTCFVLLVRRDDPDGQEPPDG